MEPIEEVESLVARKLDPALPVMRAIGVREITAYLAGDIDRETMIVDGVDGDTSICEAAIYLVSQPAAR